MLEHRYCSLTVLVGECIVKIQNLIKVLPVLTFVVPPGLGTQIGGNNRAPLCSFLFKLENAFMQIKYHKPNHLVKSHIINAKLLNLFSLSHYKNNLLAQEVSHA